MELIYHDNYICVCVKPPKVNSTDIPGGLPSLVREALGDENACVRTVHRLDQVVSGLMVLARTRRAASELSAQIREQGFVKEYMAVVKGSLPQKQGRLRDLLLRDKAERKTYVVSEPGRDVQEALLDYRVLAERDGLSLVAIQLITGRTHQIRCQFSSRGLPLIGDKKYDAGAEDCHIALWSARLEFDHPRTGGRMAFAKEPPDTYPWNLFK